jgi:maltooligosyltrehalose trehalohydrolase
MHHFSIWAPRVDSIAVKTADGVYPMTRGERGWWNADVASADDNSDYAFLVNDDPTPYPDPRSARQPYGVHGASRVVDHSRFEWTDKLWHAPPLSSGIVYEMHVGTFTQQGTFDAAIDRLDYLVDLGITHLELMPVASFPGNHGWSYDGVELFAPAEVYGGPDGLKRLVDACHRRGLAVLMDVVYNHFGPVGNYTGKFAPYLTHNHHTPWGDAVNFEDGGSDEVRRFFCDNAIMWLRDYHIDGLRLDAIQSMVDRSAIHFLEQLSAEVEKLSVELGRDLVLIAESDLNDPRVVTQRKAGGYGLDAQWSDDFHHALFAVLSGENTGYYSDFGSMAFLARSLERVFVFGGEYSPSRGRNHGRPVEGVSMQRFLGYIQDHDQIGNRAKGDRLVETVGTERAKVAAAIVLTAPFVPMLFQGEEFAASTPFQYFADHDDPLMARSVSEGRRLEFAAFGWRAEEIPDPEDRETFLRSKLRWEDLREPDHAKMLDWYRALIRLRKSQPDLNDGELGHTTVQFDEIAKWLVMTRGKVIVMCNLGSDVQRLPRGSGARVLLASRDEIICDDSSFILPRDSVVIAADESG